MHTNKGLTLIELMVVLGIMGILSAIAVPSVVSWRNGMQLSAAVRETKNGIEKTRIIALKTNAPARLEFGASGAFGIARWDPAVNDFGTPEIIRMPPGVTINANVGSLAFNGRGLLNSPGGTLTLQHPTGALCRQIVVASTGSSRIAECP